MIRISHLQEFVDVGGVIHAARCHTCNRRLGAFTICPSCHWIFCATHQCFDLHIQGRNGQFCLEKHRAPVVGI